MFDNLRPDKYTKMLLYTTTKFDQNDYFVINKETNVLKENKTCFDAIKRKLLLIFHLIRNKLNLKCMKQISF